MISFHVLPFEAVFTGSNVEEINTSRNWYGAGVALSNSGIAGSSGAAVLYNSSDAVGIDRVALGSTGGKAGRAACSLVFARSQLKRRAGTLVSFTRGSRAIYVTQIAVKTYQVDKPDRLAEQKVSESQASVPSFMQADGQVSN